MDYNIPDNVYGYFATSTTLLGPNSKPLKLTRMFSWTVNRCWIWLLECFNFVSGLVLNPENSQHFCMERG